MISIRYKFTQCAVFNSLRLLEFEQCTSIIVVKIGVLKKLFLHCPQCLDIVHIIVSIKMSRFLTLTAT